MIEQSLKITGNHKPGCFSRPPTDKFGSYPAQDGWEDGKRRMVMAQAPWKKMGCGYSERASDAKCVGCRWRDQ